MSSTKTTEGRARDAMVPGREAYKIGFLGVPETTSESQLAFDDDITEVGYVMNASRLWAYQPVTMTGLFNLLRQANSADSLSLRQRIILVAACTSAFGDSYCSLVWASKLATAGDAQSAAGILRGSDDGQTAASGSWLVGPARWRATQTPEAPRTCRRYATPDSATHRSSRSRCSLRCA